MPQILIAMNTWLIYPVLLGVFFEVRSPPSSLPLEACPVCCSAVFVKISVFFASSASILISTPRCVVKTSEAFASTTYPEVSPFQFGRSYYQSVHPCYCATIHNSNIMSILEGCESPVKNIMFRDGEHGDS